MTLLILLFAIKLLARLSIFKSKKEPWAFCKDSQTLKSVHCFCKKPPSCIFDKVLNTLELASKVRDVSFLNQSEYQK